MQFCFSAIMYGETGYHGAYAASNPEASNGMHRSPGQGQLSCQTDVFSDVPRQDANSTGLQAFVFDKF